MGSTIDVPRTQMSYLGRPENLPAPGRDPQRMVTWVEDGIYFMHPQRARDVAMYRRAELYDQGFQWLWRSMAAYDTPGSPSQWTQIYWADDDPARVPIPVFNEGHSARVNESARLGRPQYMPIARARGDRPDIRKREGAKQSESMLKHRLHEQEWRKEQEQSYLHMPLYGGAYLLGEWVMTWDDLEPVPVLTAKKCPVCGFTVSKPQVGVRSPELQKNPDLAQQLRARTNAAPIVPGQPVNGSGDYHDLKACPQCPTAPQLQPYQPTISEVQKGMKDSLGRPLGNMQPRGNCVGKVPSPYDIFVRNLGYDARPGQIGDWVYAHIEHLEYADLRWPQAAYQLRPESAAELAKWHPLAGAPDIYGGVMEGKTFKEHVRIKERHRKPWIEYTQEPAEDGLGTWAPLNDLGWYWRLNRGRSTVCVGNTILFDGPLMMESVNHPGELIQRQYLDYVPWEFRDGGRRLQGYGAWELMFDPQDAVNQLHSQIQSVRQRLAVPIYIVPRTSNMQIQGMMTGVPGVMASIDVDPTIDPSFPKLFNNTTIAEGVERELADAVSAVHRLPGHTATEAGTPPPGVDAALALEQLKQSAGENREPRILRYAEALKRLFNYLSSCQRAFYLSPRECRYEDENGDDRWAYYKGTDLEHDIEIDVEPDMVDDDKRRTVVKDLLQSQLVSAQDSPTMRRKLVRAFGDGVPEELFEDEDLQETAAQREWIYFWEEGRVPQVDPSLDDNMTHYQCHGRDAHKERFRDLEEKAGWDAALKILDIGGGWFANMDQLKMTVDNQCLQDRIYNLWQSALQQAQFQPPIYTDPSGVPRPEVGVKALQQVTLWRAHMEAHRMEEEAKQARGQVQPTLASPGAKSTAAGTTVTPPSDGNPAGQPGNTTYPTDQGPNPVGANGVPGAANPQDAQAKLGQMGGVMGPQQKIAAARQAATAGAEPQLAPGSQGGGQ